MNHGHDGLMQLSAVYKVTLEMFGNTIFYQGMLIFIDHRQLGGTDFDPTVGRAAGKTPSVANSLGIGGYHLITRVNSNIEPGNFTTTVEAQFVYSGDGSASNNFKKKTVKVKPEDLTTSVFTAQSVDNVCRKIILSNEIHLDDMGTTPVKDKSSLSDQQLDKGIEAATNKQGKYGSGGNP